MTSLYSAFFPRTQASDDLIYNESHFKWVCMYIVKLLGLALCRNLFRSNPSRLDRRNKKEGGVERTIGGLQIQCALGWGFFLPFDTTVLIHTFSAPCSPCHWSMLWWIADWVQFLFSLKKKKKPLGITRIALRNLKCTSLWAALCISPRQVKLAPF